MKLKNMRKSKTHVDCESECDLLFNLWMGSLFKPHINKKNAIIIKITIEKKQKETYIINIEVLRLFPYQKFYYQVIQGEKL